MNIDNLTIGEAKSLAAFFNGQSQAPAKNIGQKCIIRCYASGVHFGEVVEHNGRQVTLKDARRIWRFDVKKHGISLSEVALYGSDGSRSKITSAVAEITLLDALEIIPCTAEAAEQLDAATVAAAS
tara:strand:+ start:6075 stop:6452 length:378 start_codon:yes stop_codon:yes gene_type:complete